MEWVGKAEAGNPSLTTMSVMGLPELRYGFGEVRERKDQIHRDNELRSTEGD